VKIEYRVPSEDEFAAVLGTTHMAFGEELKDDDLERHRKMMPLDRLLVAWDGGRPVGVTGSYLFELTTPGGSGKAAGVSWVGVLPSHRRRGILRELMLRQLDDVHERGEPFAILYASESVIYGRFGYGMAVLGAQMDANRNAFALRDDPGPRGSARLLTMEEAAERFPPLYERLRRTRPGYLTRSEDWWRQYRLADPEHWRDGAGPKYYALLELDGKPAGFAMYRVASKWEDETPKGEVRVVDAHATSPEATAELWRFLFGIDLVERVKCGLIDPAWPLLHLVRDPRRLKISVSDGLWLRFVDLEAALRARTFADGKPAVLEVTDAVREGNAGRWSIGPEPGRTDAEPDVAVDVTDLASVYLGAFSFERLAAAGRARQVRPGGVARATALFATPLPPFCPEGF
jgi:predicted acetyltransferase